MAVNMNLFIKQLNTLIQTDKVDRKVLLSVHARVTDRIFGEGKAADTSQIGNYSKGYLKQRQKNKWGGSSKVILQYTGQMKNDFSLIRSGNDLGSGFKNKKNGDKSRWVEGTYDKTIFDLTQSESELIDTLYANELNKLGRGN